MVACTGRPVIVGNLVACQANRAHFFFKSYHWSFRLIQLILSHKVSILACYLEIFEILSPSKKAGSLCHQASLNNVEAILSITSFVVFARSRGSTVQGIQAGQVLRSILLPSTRVEMQTRAACETTVQPTLH